MTSSPAPIDACLVCGNRTGYPLAVGHRHGIPAPVALCSGCGLLFQSPVPTADALDAFYRERYREVYSGSSVPTDEFLADQRSHGAEILAFCAGHLRPGSSVLDLGCGPGGTLEPFRDAGHRVTGLEPGPYGAWGAEHLGLDIRTGGVDDLGSLDDRFDLVVMSFMLEHLRDPVAALAGVPGVLAPGGSVYIEVPDLAGNAGRLADYVHVAHISYFTVSTLTQALGHAGLAAEVVDAPGTYALRVLAVAAPAEAAPGTAAPLPPPGEVEAWLATLHRRERRARVEHAARAAAKPVLRGIGRLAALLGREPDAPEQFARRTWRRLRGR